MRPIRAIALIVAAWILGGATPEVEARGLSLKVTFTTSPTPTTTYSPKNVVAVWVVNQGGTFVKTIGQWVAVRQSSLVAWRTAAGTNDVDAVSGASRANHTLPLVVAWDLKDRQGNVVPDGTYTIRLEVSESNATTPTQNNEGTFTFVKGPTAQSQTGLSGNGFSNVSITYDPNATVCSDGLVDMPEEKCDRAITAGSPGACPTACPTTDACMPAQLQGDATLCSAECLVTPITACVNGDGCCAPGCTTANDDDCAAGGPGGTPETSGGCETSGSGAGGALAFGALGLALLIRRRRR
jgi:uncharacterized protein (TIGR03382 family)